MKETREEKLERYQRLHSRLNAEGEPLFREYKSAENRWRKHNTKLKRVGRAIYDLKHQGQTPLVTDHAVVRYLERVKKIDINDLRAEVANHKNAHREGNVIVTVNPDVEESE